MNLPESFFGGAISGAVVWGLIREGLAYCFKEWSSKRKARFKTLSEEAAALIPLIDAVVVSSIKYYSVAGNENYELSTSIKASVKQIADRYSGLSRRLVEMNNPALNSFVIIRFRQSVTLDLDSKHRKAWDLSNVGLNNILDSATNLREELHDTKFNVAR